METPKTEGSPNPPQLPQLPTAETIMDTETTPAPSVLESAEAPVAGPSSTPAPAPNKRVYTKKTKKIEGQMAYTSAFVPGMYNIKIPAGDFLTKERNLDVIRQLSQAKAKQEKVDAEAERERLAGEEDEVSELHPLHHTLIIHPGSRNLRIGRASDFYPKEIPNCIARPATAPNRGEDPPIPGSRAKRVAQRALEKREVKKRRQANGEGENGDVEMNGSGNRRLDEEDSEDDNGEGKWVDPVDANIGHLRDYLRNRLVQERLATDWKESARVKAANAKVKPENLPEHNDPYRIDWTETDGRPYYIGTEALRLPENSGYKVRYPILQRSLNRRDWGSQQLLMDDIAIVLQDSLKSELGISPKEYQKYSVVFIIPDHGDRTYVQEMTHLLLVTMGFKEIAVHQEAYCAIFSAGMSSACVVDIGAQVTSVTCVDEGLVNADTRMRLNYGGDDITAALVTILQRSNFPYRDLDLAKSQDWLMMDNLKNKICTLEEHLVANTPWDFYVLKEEGMTQKYVFRTYEENILAPLVFFDTRLIDFKEKNGKTPFRFWNPTDDTVSDEITSGYDEPTGAMKACTAHLLPPPPPPASEAPETTKTNNGTQEEGKAAKSIGTGSATPVGEIKVSAPSELGTTTPIPKPASTPTPGATPVPAMPTNPFPAPAGTTNGNNAESTPVPSRPVVELSSTQIIQEAARSPLDAAIAASISMAGTENKVKVASNSILLIGGSSAMKGLGAFIADRLPPLLRQKGFPISDVSIIPPPRNLNPRFVSWKGASVMCNLESLSDMWIRKDEWEAIGGRALKDRYLYY
ncbi:hypothetical protein I317_04955 [Kwoniella heveanensis CBS 569]|nr:hypothetical protein I317_04955 [Kwoniella heveanensis CBS 569]